METWTQKNTENLKHWQVWNLKDVLMLVLVEGRLFKSVAPLYFTLSLRLYVANS